MICADRRHDDVVAGLDYQRVAKSQTFIAKNVVATKKRAHLVWRI